MPKALVDFLGKELLRFINENKNTVIVEWAMRFGRTDFKEN